MAKFLAAAPFGQHFPAAALADRSSMVLDEPAVPATKSKRHVREVSALGVWHAVLASFLFFAPSVANAETVQIIDDRGGFIIAYQMYLRQRSLTVTSTNHFSKREQC
jgi:hypothetical protein